MIVVIGGLSIVNVTVVIGEAYCSYSDNGNSEGYCIYCVSGNRGAYCTYCDSGDRGILHKLLWQWR